MNRVRLLITLSVLAGLSISIMTIALFYEGNESKQKSIPTKGTLYRDSTTTCYAVLISNDKTQSGHAISPQMTELDSIMIKHNLAIQYFTKSMDWNIVYRDCKYKYLETGNDKYRIEGNRALRKANYYNDLLQQVAKQK